MHVELVELLRCVKPHEDTWLVASVDRAEDREIVAGTLGCPICRAEYPIRDRVAYFASRTLSTRASEPDPEQAIRIAAALELTDARKIGVLHGEWGVHARFVRSVSPAPMIVLNPIGAIDPGDGVNVIVSDVAPLARRSVHGAALDSGATASLVASLVASLRPGGRLMAPVEMPLPGGFNEIARDDDVWVAERERDDVIPLRRQRAGSESGGGQSR